MPLFNGGYDVEHWILQRSSQLGGLDQHAGRRADWVVSRLTGQQDNPVILGNALLVGLLVFGFAQLTYVSQLRWEEIGEIACGLWLIASPFTFGYAESGALRYWHFLFGAAVVLLAALELWQDWKLSEKELGQH